MEYKALTTESKEFEATKAIFLEAFPPAERDKTFEQLVTFAQNNKESTAVVALDGDAVAGFYITLDAGEFIYLGYFAVNSAIRGKGYGTQIFKKIMADCGDRLAFGLIESPDEDADNNEQRLARQRFYERNGLAVVDLKHTAYGVTYNVITNNADYDFEANKEKILTLVAGIIERV